MHTNTPSAPGFSFYDIHLSHFSQQKTRHPTQALCVCPESCTASSTIRGERGKTVVCRCRNTTQVQLCTTIFYYTLNASHRFLCACAVSIFFSLPVRSARLLLPVSAIKDWFWCCSGTTRNNSKREKRPAYVESVNPQKHTRASKPWNEMRLNFLSVRLLALFRCSWERWRYENWGWSGINGFTTNQPHPRNPAAV